MHKEIEDILETAKDEIETVLQEHFKEVMAPLIIKGMGGKDQCAIDEGFNNWTDFLCKSGIIPQFIYDSVTNPDYDDLDWSEILQKALNI